jgi:predicted DNA-binding transcriptional regulator YafY
LPSIDELIPRIKELGLSLKATERLVGIVSILQEGEAVPIASIASALEVIPRTMRRDISLLYKAGIIESGTDYGTYKLTPIDKMALK